MYIAFLDFQKAYDKICREELWRAMHECEVYGYLIRSMSSLYDESRAYIRLSSRTEEYVEERRGLR